MKKALICGLALLLAAAAFIGRAAWRAHLKIVSLDIREAPLSVVLKKIEWQTWERMRAEQGLDAKFSKLTSKEL